MNNRHSEVLTEESHKSEIFGMTFFITDKNKNENKNERGIYGISTTNFTEKKRCMFRKF